MNGTLIPNTPIAVDFWQLRKCHNFKVFFLSHFHADHIQGLTSTWPHNIYCSEITKALLVHRIKIPASSIVVLEPGHGHIIQFEDSHGCFMTVTAVDANHCPGAVMFIFEGSFGKILHTGDFRFDNKMILNHPGLFDSVDILYLDNTYCNRKFDFPSREVVEKEIYDIIKSHPHSDVIIGLRNLGKEALLVNLAIQLQTWIVLTPDRYETIKLLGLPEVFTTDPTAGFIRVRPSHEVTAGNLKVWNSIKPTIGIIPTAMYCDGQFDIFTEWSLHVLPYSDHSSFVELSNFVAFVRPKRIIPVVKKKGVVFGSDVRVLDRYLNGSPLKIFNSQKSLQAWNKHWSRNTCKRRAKQAVGSLSLFKAKKRKILGVVFDSDSDSDHEEAEGHTETMETVTPTCEATKDAIGTELQCASCVGTNTSSPESMPRATGELNCCVMCGATFTKNSPAQSKRKSKVDDKKGVSDLQYTSDMKTEDTKHRPCHHGYRTVTLEGFQAPVIVIEPDEPAEPAEQSPTSFKTVLSTPSRGYSTPSSEQSSPSPVYSTPSRVVSPPSQGQSPPSPVYSPVSLVQSPPSPVYSPVSLVQSPPSPVYSPVSLVQSPPSPVYSPVSLVQSPPSPVYSPVSLVQSPPSPVYSPVSLVQSPPSPVYSTPCRVVSPPSQGYSTPLQVVSPPIQGQSLPSPIQLPSSLVQSCHVQLFPPYIDRTGIQSPPSPVYSTPSRVVSPPSQGHSTPSPVYSPASVVQSPPSPVYSTPSQIQLPSSLVQSCFVQLFPPYIDRTVTSTLNGLSTSAVGSALHPDRQCAALSPNKAKRISSVKLVGVRYHMPGVPSVKPIYPPGSGKRVKPIRLPGKLS